MSNGQQQGAGYGFAVTRDEGLYDWNTVPVGAIADQEVLFFTRGINGRNYADTNLETVGKMPGDRAQKIMGITLWAAEAPENDAAADTAVRDLLTLLKYSELELQVNNQIMLRVPAGRAAGDIGMTGQLGSLDAGFVQLGTPGAYGYIIRDPKRYISCQGNSTIRVRLKFSVNAPDIAANRYVGVYLPGPQAFQAGRV